MTTGEMASAYAGGKSVAQVARLAGVSVTTATRMLREAGVVMRTRSQGRRMAQEQGLGWRKIRFFSR